MHNKWLNFYVIYIESLIPILNTDINEFKELLKKRVNNFNTDELKELFEFIVNNSNLDITGINIINSTISDIIRNKN